MKKRIVFTFFAVLALVLMMLATVNLFPDRYYGELDMYHRQAMSFVAMGVLFGIMIDRMTAKVIKIIWRQRGEGDDKKQFG